MDGVEMKPVGGVRLAFWVVAMVTVVGALFLVAIGDLLPAAAVCAVGVVLMLVLGHLSRSDSSKPSQVSAEQQRRNAKGIVVAGLSTLALGGVLTLVWPGELANLLLIWTGPGLTLGGVAAYGMARSGQSGDQQ